MRRVIRMFVSAVICFQVGGCVVGGSFSSGGRVIGGYSGGATILPATPSFGTPFASATGSTGVGQFGSSGFNNFTPGSFQQNSLNLPGGSGRP